MVRRSAHGCGGDVDVVRVGIEQSRREVEGSGTWRGKRLGTNHLSRNFADVITDSQAKPTTLFCDYLKFYSLIA